MDTNAVNALMLERLRQRAAVHDYEDRQRAELKRKAQALEESMANESLLPEWAKRAVLARQVEKLAAEPVVPSTGQGFAAMNLLLSIAQGRQATKPQTRVTRLEELHRRDYGDDLEEAKARVNMIAANAYLQCHRDRTESSYASATGSFHVYNDIFKTEPYPVSEQQLIKFLAWSSNRLKSAGSMSDYLNAIRSEQIDRGMAIPWKDRAKDMPMLDRVLKGFKWIFHLTEKKELRRPLTMEVLEDGLAAVYRRHHQLKEEGKEPSVYSLQNYYTLAAVCATAFQAMLRPGEVSVRTTSKGVKTEPLRIKHHRWVFAAQDGERVIGESVLIPVSKTDQFGERLPVQLGLSGSAHVCATNRTGDMLTRRHLAGEDINDPNAFLFALSSDGGITKRPLGYADLTKAIDDMMTLCGRDSTDYKGHSFRIGAATTLSRNGVPPSIIEDMGGWKRGSLSLPRYERELASERTRRSMARYFTESYAPLGEEAQGPKGKDDFNVFLGRGQASR